MMAANGFAQGVIDVHSHIITPEFVYSLENEGRLLDEGFPLPKYNVKNHLKWMDEAGVQTSVLTLAAPQPSSAEVVRQTNEDAARIKKEHPGRFLFCAALPLPDVNAAIREAIYSLDTLKADGIKLATNVGGQYLGAPELDTLFSVLNERKAVVILHPHRPEPVNKQVMQQTPLAMQEYLSETTRAVSNMISRNLLARYNNIKVVVPHCGAYLPLAPTKWWERLTMRPTSVPSTTTLQEHTRQRLFACCSPSPRPTICSTAPTIPTSLHRCSSRVWRG